jgi:hypothetical protein
MGDTFIHSALDEAGLSPAEFRVFCHVSRRAGENGRCYAAIESFADVCRLSLPTVRKALRSLSAQGFISQTRRDGQTTIYKPTPLADWKPYAKVAPLQKEDRGSVVLHPTPAKAVEATPVKRRPLSISPEGDPSKAIPIKPVALTRDGKRTLELMEQCREVFGDEEMKRPECRKRWLGRADAKPKKLQAVLDDVAQEKRLRVLDNPAAFAETLWSKVYHNPANN